MQAGHIGRHTRRGFYRGDAAPKFFALAPLPSTTPSRNSNEKTPIVSVPADLVRAALSEQSLDFRPHPSHLLHHTDGSLTAPSGHAFLSWLADQLAGQASATPAKTQALPASGEEVFDFTPGDESDLQVDYLLDDNSLLSTGEGEQEWSVDLSHGLEASFAPHDDASDFAHLSDHIARGKMQPEVLPWVDGGRVEHYPSGSRVIKDVLGRVVEVHSHLGESLYFRYGIFGKVEYFQRTNADGRTHSEGRRDRHGVVVRDSEGRVRAAGESLTVDPRGCLYLHALDGQYFSLDLVTGILSERRLIKDERGRSRFVTSLFTHDGFRMATMFSPVGTTYGAGYSTADSRFRFYGRDGTVIEFASEDDLHELNPALVSAPGARKVSSDWLSRRQAVTAWDSVHDYLMRVS